MKKKAISILLILLMLLGLTGSAGAEGKRIADFANARIGVTTGSVQAQELPVLLPEASITEYNTMADAAMALSSGRLDAFSTDESVYLTMKREGMAFERIEEPLLVSEYGMLFGKNAPDGLKNDFNRFLKESSENGLLPELKSKWFGDTEPEGVLSCEGFTGEKGRILYAVEPSVKPFAYMKNGELTGFDVELMIHFARDYGYELVPEDTTFGGLLTGIEQGRYDMAGSGVTITEERKETMEFSEAYHTEDIVLVVPAGTRIQDLANSCIGVVTGSPQAIELPKMLPEAELLEFNATTEAALALSQGKIDSFSTDESTYLAMRREGQPFARIDEPFMISEYGVLFGGGYDSKLLGEFNAFLAAGMEDGTLTALQEKWFGDEEPTELISADSLSGENGSITFATSAGQKPYSFVKDGRYAGFDIEMAILFAQQYGYSLEIVDTTFSGMLQGVEQGKYDMAAAGITITEERKASIAISDPYYEEEVVMVILEGGLKKDDGFSFRESFEKTFIREDRWKLIVQGLGVTLLISACAVVGGSIFGFGLYLLARSRYRAVSAVTKTVVRVYGRLIAGTPTLVVLMILFYVIFGKTDVDGIWVAVLGFALTFGSFVYSHLDLCVDGVDHGQTEASYALGYTRNQTFFKIILPQSMKNFLPTYTGEVVGLIKATSVVGYIAVSDLTKMGDIIRSNTYEAMFPLLAVAVIYFVITWGAAALLGLVQKKMDNLKRKDKNILKGVVR